jgi:hypothetical protein
VDWPSTTEVPGGLARFINICTRGAGDEAFSPAGFLCLFTVRPGPENEYVAGDLPPLLLPGNSKDTPAGDPLRAVAMLGRGAQLAKRDLADVFWNINAPQRLVVSGISL